MVNKKELQVPDPHEAAREAGIDPYGQAVGGEKVSKAIANLQQTGNGGKSVARALREALAGLVRGPKKTVVSTGNDRSAWVKPVPETSDEAQKPPAE